MTLQALRLNEKPSAVLIQSALSIWFGLLMLTLPGFTGRSIVLILGLFLIADSGFTLLSKAGARSRASLILSAIAMAAGTVALINPRWLGVPLIFAFSLWALFHGGINIIAMYSRRSSRRLALWFGLSGAASVGIALWVFSHLGADITTLLRSVGIFGVVYGYTLLGLSYELTRAQEGSEKMRTHLDENRKKAA